MYRAALYAVAGKHTSKKHISVQEETVNLLGTISSARSIDVLCSSEYLGQQDGV